MVTKDDDIAQARNSIREAIETLKNLEIIKLNSSIIQKLDIPQYKILNLEDDNE